MSKASLLGSCEVAINTAIKRLSKLEGQNKKAIENEFKEWIIGMQSEEKNYDVLYINKISKK